MFRLSAAVAAALLLSACGLDSDPPSDNPDTLNAYTATNARPAEVPVARIEAAADPSRLQKLGAEKVAPVATAHALVAKPVEPDTLNLLVDVQPVMNGTAVGGLLAVAGCGWFPVAKTSGTVANGQVSFTFPWEGSTSASLFFYFDKDGDGACDESKGDEVFSAGLGEVSAGNVSVSTSQTEPSAGCEMFSFLP